jgi:hypothetical protein
MDDQAVVLCPEQVICFNLMTVAARVRVDMDQLVLVCHHRSHVTLIPSERTIWGNMRDALISSANLFARFTGACFVCETRIGLDVLCRDTVIVARVRNGVMALLSVVEALIQCTAEPMELIDYYWLYHQGLLVRQSIDGFRSLVYLCSFYTRPIRHRPAVHLRCSAIITRFMHSLSTVQMPEIPPRTSNEHGVPEVPPEASSEPGAAVLEP